MSYACKRLACAQHYLGYLCKDVEAALAAGIQDISVFSLEGILNSSQPETWLEMIYSAPPRIPQRSRKEETIRKAAGVGYRLMPG